MRLAPCMVVAACVIVGSGARAQTSYKRDIPDSLAKLAKIDERAAATVAQKRVPRATIEAVELEREHGKLMFSYDMKTAGKSGIDEVNVDAITGKVIGFSHESPATERKEAAADAKENAAKKAPAKKP
jgi:hypothetical protein